MKSLRILALLAACAAGCGGGGVADLTGLQLGDPLPGLTEARRMAFIRGKAMFEHRFTLSEGHGPDFNTSSCASCHSIPVTGGSSPRYRNFVMARNGNGTNFFEDNQLVARTFSYVRKEREPIAGAAVVVQRNSPPLFGLGLLERIPTQIILQNEDPLDSNGDGISGRANREDGLVGLFGFKAQESNLEDFIRGPFFNHMGITSNPLSFGGGAQLAQVGEPGVANSDTDARPDPELLHQDLLDILTWLQELAPPSPLPLDTEALLGSQVFDTIGCGACHIQNMGAVTNLYSDLLLHDMGPGLADGITMEQATGTEFRTQPLWGLRHHAPYLHDGRADTIDAAILAHGGEAQRARDLYATHLNKDAVVRFLETR